MICRDNRRPRQASRHRGKGLLRVSKPENIKVGMSVVQVPQPVQARRIDANMDHMNCCLPVGEGDCLWTVCVQEAVAAAVFFFGQESNNEEPHSGRLDGRHGSEMLCVIDEEE